MSADGRRGFVGVDRHWLNDPDLTDRDLRLMLWLDSHTDEYLSNLNISTVAKQIGWARNKVKRALEALIFLDLISSELLPMRGGGTRTQITLHLSRWTDRDLRRDGPQRTSAMVHDGPSTVVHDDATTYSNPNGEESTSGTLVPAKRERQRDPIWDAAVDACGVDVDGLTRTALGNVGKTVKELKEVGATPEDIYARAAIYRRKFPDAALTIAALRKHWAELTEASIPRPNGRRTPTEVAITTDIQRRKAVRAAIEAQTETSGELT